MLRFKFADLLLVNNVVFERFFVSPIIQVENGILILTFFKVECTVTFLILDWSKNILRITVRDLWTLSSETSIEIYDFFKNTKNALVFTILVGCGCLTNSFLLFGLQWLRANKRHTFANIYIFKFYI